MSLKIGDKVRIIPREDVIGDTCAYIIEMLKFAGKETYVVGLDIFDSSKLFLNISGNNGFFWRKLWLQKVEN